MTIDAVLAIFEVLSSVPDVVTDPTGYLEKVQSAGEKVSKLAGLIPQVSVPKMIQDVIALIISALEATLTLISQVEDLYQSAQDTANLAAQLGDSRLADVAVCLEAQADQFTKHIGASLGPIGDILNLASKLLSLVPGTPALPSLNDLSGQSLSAIKEAIETLLDVLRALQIP
jgi:hypothetical protein